MIKTDLQNLSDEQLVHHELGLERALFGHQLRHRLNQLDNNSVLKRTRREIARSQTALRSRELVNGLSRGALRQQHAASFVPASAAAADAGGGFLKGLLNQPSDAAPLDSPASPE